MKELHLNIETQSYFNNQVVLYEGIPADFIIFVKKGLFEVSRTFDEDDCFLTGTRATEPLSRANHRI